MDYSERLLLYAVELCFFFFSSRRRHTRYWRDWSSDVCSSDLGGARRIELTAKRLKARGISSIEAGIGEPRLQGGRLAGPLGDQGLQLGKPALVLVGELGRAGQFGPGRRGGRKLGRRQRGDLPA